MEDNPKKIQRDINLWQCWSGSYGKLREVWEQLQIKQLLKTNNSEYNCMYETKGDKGLGEDVTDLQEGDEQEGTSIIQAISG